MRRIATVLTAALLPACSTPSFARADLLAPDAAHARAATQLDCPLEKVMLDPGVSQLDEVAGLKRYWYRAYGCEAVGELRADCTPELCTVELLHLEHTEPPKVPYLQPWTVDVFFEGPNRGERPWPLPNSLLDYTSVRCVFGDAPACTPKCTTELPAQDDPKAKQMTCSLLRPTAVSKDAMTALQQVMSGRTAIWPPELDDTSLHRIELVLRSPQCAEAVEERVGAPEAFVRRPEGGTLTAITLYRQAAIFRFSDAPRPKLHTLHFTIAGGTTTREHTGLTWQSGPTPWSTTTWSGRPQISADGGTESWGANDVPTDQWKQLAKSYPEETSTDGHFESTIAHLMAGQTHAAATEFREWEGTGAPGGSAPASPDSTSSFETFFGALETGTAWLDDPCAR